MMLRTKIPTPYKRHIIVDVSTISIAPYTNLLTGAADFIRVLREARSSVIVFCDSSDQAIVQITKLLDNNSLSDILVYGSPERLLQHPPGFIFEKYCNYARLGTDECIYIDSRANNRKRAQALGMNVVPFSVIKNADNAVSAFKACLKQMKDRGIVTNESCLTAAKSKYTKHTFYSGTLPDELKSKEADPDNGAVHASKQLK